MPDFGLIVVLQGTGKDVFTAAPEECAIHSKYPCIKAPLATSPFRYFNTGSYTFSSNPTPGSTTDMLTVNHNLGYTPISFGYYNQPDPSFGLNGFGLLPWSYSDAGYIYAIANCDNNNFKIQFVRLSDGGGPFDALDLTGLHFDFKYYLFVENAA